MNDDLTPQEGTSPNSTSSEVTFWTTELQQGIDYQKKHSQSEKWVDYRKMYRGEWKSGIYPVNRIFSYGRALIPRIYFRSPRVTITATRPELVPHALVLEAVDNWLIKETRLKKVLKKAILHGFLCGIGPIKLGYDSQFGYNPEQSVDQNAGTVTQVGRKTGSRIEYNQSISPGMPWAEAIMPEDLIVPWGTRSPEDMPWVAHRILRPYDDVMEDQKYSNKKDLHGTRMADLRQRVDSPLFKDKELKLCELYEIRDYKYSEVLTICENRIIFRDDDSLQIEGLPYEFIIFNEDPEFFWPISDATIITPQQLELNEIRTQASYHRRIALLKFLYQKGVVTPEDMETFLSGKVGIAVGINADSLATAIVTLQPHIPPELAQEAMLVLQDLRESMGFAENQVGSFTRKQNTTATETQQVAESFDVRVDERKDIVADVLENVLRKWNQYIFSFWDSEKVMKIVGPMGQLYWVKFTGEELLGEYNYRIDPESGFPITSQLRRQFADGLMKQYGGDQLINPIELRKFHLSQYEDIRPGIQGLVQPPLPTPENAAAQEYQPHPQGGGSGGAGAKGGTGGLPTPQQNPISFQEFQKKVTGK